MKRDFQNRIARSICFAGRLMARPAVPYREGLVQTAVREIAAESGLAVNEDRFGNLLVRLETAPRRRPMVLVAHMDHPGFVVERRGRRPVVRFLGSVPDRYLRPGTAIRLMPGGVPATLGRRVGAERVFGFSAARKLETPPEFAVWELEDFALRQGRIYGRACDDLVGVATVLGVLAELRRSRARVHVLGLITRAEEVGFQGALVAAASRLLPRDALVISLETSKEIPPVRQGDGVIIRVGDRASIFDSAASRFLAEVCGDLQKADPSFAFQRALMSGGTCEATALQEFGYRTAAVCVALGNYHNCGDRSRIRAEHVNVADVVSMQRLLVGAVRQVKDFDVLVGRLPQRLKRLLAEGRQHLVGGS